MESITKELRITEETGDVIDVYPDSNKYPVIYQRKIHELTTGMTKEEAELYLLQSPIQLELFYDLDRGLFAVESEAVESCEIYNPYTGREIPNDNLPSREDPSPAKILDMSIGNLEDMNTDLDNVWKEGDFTIHQCSLIEEARELIEEALSKLHRVTDPDGDEEG